MTPPPSLRVGSIPTPWGLPHYSNLYSNADGWGRTRATGDGLSLTHPSMNPHSADSDGQPRTMPRWTFNPLVMGSNPTPLTDLR